MDAKPKPVNLIQVYMLILATEDEDVMNVYALIQNIVDSIPERERLIVVGDFNAKIGEVLRILLVDFTD